MSIPHKAESQYITTSKKTFKPFSIYNPAKDVLDIQKKVADEKAEQARIAAENARKAAEAAEQARQAQLAAEQEKEAQKASNAVNQVTPQPYTVTGGCVTGYSTGQYALDQLIAHESGGRSCATNPGGCFGLLQACPGEPLRAACGGNPDCQIAWFIANKTGGRSWEQIWASWQIKGWW